MNDVLSLAKEYLALREKSERMKNRMNEIRLILQERIKKEGNLQVDDKKFTVAKRIYYEYDQGKAKEILGDKYVLVAKSVIDKRKVAGLIKGGFITEEELEPAKVITKEITALVIK